MSREDFANGRRWSVVCFEIRQPHFAGGQYVHNGGTTCERCGQAIVRVVTLRSTDGQKLSVGVDCAATLEGGPDLADVRAAEHAWRREQARKEWEEHGRAARDARISWQEKVAAENAKRYAVELAECDEVEASPRTSRYAKGVAAAVSNALRKGLREDSYSLDGGQYKGEHNEARTIAAALVEARAPESRHVGEVNGRVEMIATCVAEIDLGPDPYSFSGGHRYLVKFVSDEGHVLIWFTTSAAFEVLERARIRATVGKHDEREGVAQTIVKRVSKAPEEKPQPAKKPRAKKGAAAAA